MIVIPHMHAQFSGVPDNSIIRYLWYYSSFLLDENSFNFTKHRIRNRFEAVMTLRTLMFWFKSRIEIRYLVLWSESFCMYTSHDYLRVQRDRRFRNEPSKQLYHFSCSFHTNSLMSLNRLVTIFSCIKYG